MDGQLQQAIKSIIADIDNQILVVVNMAVENGVSSYEVRNPDGTLVLVPLLLAKAQSLNALAALKSSKK